MSHAKRNIKLKGLRFSKPITKKDLEYKGDPMLNHGLLELMVTCPNEDKKKREKKERKVLLYQEKMDRIAAREINRLFNPLKNDPSNRVSTVSDYPIFDEHEDNDPVSLGSHVFLLLKETITNYKPSTMNSVLVQMAEIHFYIKTIILSWSILLCLLNYLGIFKKRGKLADRTKASKAYIDYLSSVEKLKNDVFENEKHLNNFYESFQKIHAQANKLVPAAIKGKADPEELFEKAKFLNFYKNDLALEEPIHNVQKMLLTSEKILCIKEDILKEQDTKQKLHLEIKMKKCGMELQNKCLQIYKIKKQGTEHVTCYFDSISEDEISEIVQTEKEKIDIALSLCEKYCEVSKGIQNVDEEEERKLKQTLYDLERRIEDHFPELIKIYKDM